MSAWNDSCDDIDDATVSELADTSNRNTDFQFGGCVARWPFRSGGRTFHLVLIDDGRRVVRGGPDLKKILYCIDLERVQTLVSVSNMWEATRSEDRHTPVVPRPDGRLASKASALRGNLLISAPAVPEA